MLGGIGIFVGIQVGFWVAVAVGAAPASKELVAIIGGISILFAAGLLDDLFSLGPIPKLAAQFAAAGLVIFNGVTVSARLERFPCGGVALVWLVGHDERLQPARQHGRPCGHARRDRGCVLRDRRADRAPEPRRARALARVRLLVRRLPAVQPPPRQAGRGLHGRLGQPGARVRARVARFRGELEGRRDDRRDTAAADARCSPCRSSTRRSSRSCGCSRAGPMYQGGRDHTSHRLVYHGLSEKRAVVLLASISAGLGATSLAYSVLDNTRVTFIGVLLTFALLVQFASLLVGRRARPRRHRRSRPAAHASSSNARRLVEVARRLRADHRASFSVAYFLRLQGGGTRTSGTSSSVALPCVLAARYLAFIPFGLYRGVWRYAGARDAARDRRGGRRLGGRSRSRSSTRPVLGDFPRSVFVIDALVCTVLIGASRFWERAFVRGVSSLTGRGDRHRTLIVGAGRSGRSLLRELRETPGEQVVGFVDDDPRLSRRRLQGVPVLGGTPRSSAILARTRPDIGARDDPGRAARAARRLVIDACALAGVPCRFVRRQTRPRPATPSSAQPPTDARVAVVTARTAPAGRRLPIACWPRSRCSASSSGWRSSTSSRRGRTRRRGSSATSSSSLSFHARSPTPGMRHGAASRTPSPRSGATCSRPHG